MHAITTVDGSKKFTPMDRQTHPYRPSSQFVIGHYTCLLPSARTLSSPPVARTWPERGPMATQLVLLAWATNSCALNPVKEPREPTPEIMILVTSRSYLCESQSVSPRLAPSPLLLLLPQSRLPPSGLSVSFCPKLMQWVRVDSSPPRSKAGYPHTRRVDYNKRGIVSSNSKSMSAS